MPLTLRGMRRVTYAGGSFLTGDDISDAVLEYAAALANRQQAASIHVPAADLPEGATTIDLLVGPSSQLLSEPVTDVVTVPDGTAFIADLAERTRALNAPWSPIEHDSPSWDF